MNSLPKLMMISFMTQCHLLCDANGNSSNVGPYGGVMTLRKDMKHTQQFENNLLNPEEKWINDGKSSEVATHFDEFSIIPNLNLSTLISNSKLYLINDHYNDFR